MDTWMVWWMGSMVSVCMNVKEAKSHVIADQLTETEWVMPASSPPPPSPSQTFYIPRLLLNSQPPTPDWCLTSFFFYHPFILSLQLCSLSLLTSSSTSTRWEPRGRSCWISCLSFVWLYVWVFFILPFQGCWLCCFSCVICRCWSYARCVFV